jgi:hypothetical protein
MVHTPGGDTSSNDPICEALVSLGIRVGKFGPTTLSLNMLRSTPADIGSVFPFLPAGQSLPNDEYIIWVGEYLVADDPQEMARRIGQLFPANK